MFRASDAAMNVWNPDTNKDGEKAVRHAPESHRKKMRLAMGETGGVVNMGRRICADIGAAQRSIGRHKLANGQQQEWRGGEAH